MNKENLYLTQDEVSELLKISVRTLERMRVEGTGPLYSKAGRRVLYRFSDIEGWIKQNTRRSTCELHTWEMILAA